MLGDRASSWEFPALDGLQRLIFFAPGETKPSTQSGDSILA
jgi:hypothetical protein